MSGLIYSLLYFLPSPYNDDRQKAVLTAPLNTKVLSIYADEPAIIRHGHENLRELHLST